MGAAEIKLEIIGDKSIQNLDNESGGHRIQRIPPTEKRGRIHTSTVTVAVLDDSIQVDRKYDQLSNDDFRVEWFSGTGKGGQHRNKHQNSCRLIHIPTGIIETRQGRERSSNYEDAKQALLKRLQVEKNNAFYGKQSTVRKDMVGSGMRGDKRRTYRFQDDIVTDHKLNTKCSCVSIMKGKFEEIWS